MLEIQVCLAILGIILVCLVVWIGTISSRVEGIENLISNETSHWSTIAHLQHEQLGMLQSLHIQDEELRNYTQELSNHTKALEALFERTESLEKNKSNSVKLS